jgi:hypothetical protein
MSIEPVHRITSLPAVPRIATYNYTPPAPPREPMKTDASVAIWFAVVGSVLIVIVLNAISWGLMHLGSDWTQKCSDLYNNGYDSDCYAPLPHLWGWCFGLSAGWCALMAWFLWRHRWYQRHPNAAALMGAATVAYAGYKLYEHHEQKEADRIGRAVAAAMPRPESPYSTFVPTQDLSHWDQGR